MNVAEIMEKRNAFSFEVFPPKTDVGMEKLCGEGGVLEQLYTLHPDYISCTYGAGGTNVGKNLEVLDKITKDGKAIGVTHFTCVGNTKEGIKEQLNTYLDHGINHMLALRGDLPRDGAFPHPDGYHHASELMEEIRTFGGFCIGGACYPEGHPESATLYEDIDNLKYKVDAGCEFLTTQMFFDNNELYSYLYKLRRSGIDIPVIAGIMPVTNASQIKRIMSLSGSQLPARFRAIIDRFAGLDRAAGEELGIEISVQAAKAALPYADGFYLMTPFNRVALMERLIARLKEEVIKD